MQAQNNDVQISIAEENLGQIIRPADVPYVDLRVYTEEGELDLVASKKRHEEDAARRFIRNTQKRGRPHECVMHTSDGMIPATSDECTTRQQKRAFRRAAFKLALRHGKECHPVRVPKIDGYRMRRAIRLLSKEA